MGLATIKSSAVRWLAQLGGYAIARRLTAAQPKILMYHRFSETPAPGKVDRATWRAQLEYLRQHHQVMTLAQFMEKRAADEVPAHTVVLTIDDGYHDFYTVAFDELQRAGLTATLFVTTGFVDGQQWLWPDRLHYLMQQVPGRMEIPVGDSSHAFTLPTEFGPAWRLLMSILLPLPLAEKETWISQLATRHGVPLPELPPAAFAPTTWAALREMQTYGIEIGGHSVSHPILSAESSARIEAEISGCKARLDAELPRPVTSFCYPNGERRDYDERCQRAVAAAGFNCAVAAHHDHLQFDNAFDLPRYSGSADPFHFAKVVSGIDYLGRSVKKLLR